MKITAYIIILTLCFSNLGFTASLTEETPFIPLMMNKQRAILSSVTRNISPAGSYSRLEMKLKQSVPVKIAYGKISDSSSWIRSKFSFSKGFDDLLESGGELATQIYAGKDIDWRQLGDITILKGGSSYFGTKAGSFVQTPFMKNSTQLLSKLTAPRLVSLIGRGASKTFISGTVFSYGAYALGYSDLRTANRNLLATSAGSAIGALSGTTAIGMVGMFGTASTGTAISTLSGAAATNATVAWFGGGALAAGGGGTAVGATVISGGVALIAIAAGAGIMYLFHIDDERVEKKRVERLIENIEADLRQQVKASSAVVE